VAGELLWIAVGGGLARMHQGDAAGEHSPEPAGVCPDRHQVPRTADDAVAHRDFRVIQEL